MVSIDLFLVITLDITIIIIIIIIKSIITWEDWLHWPLWGFWHRVYLSIWASKKTHLPHHLSLPPMPPSTFSLLLLFSKLKRIGFHLHQYSTWHLRLHCGCSWFQHSSGSHSLLPCLRDRDSNGGVVWIHINLFIWYYNL